MITIAIIDRYPFVRVSFEIFFKNNFEEVAILEFDSLQHFSNFCQSDPEKSSDLIFVGSTLELTVSHCEMIKCLKRTNSITKVVVYDERPYFNKVSLYIKSGVTGYLTKLSDMQELVKCTRDVLSGKNYIGKEIMDVLLPQWLLSDEIDVLKNRKPLTPREYEIADLLINGSSVSSISKKLLKTTSTVRSTKKNIFKKLGINSLIDLKDSLYLQ